MPAISALAESGDAPIGTIKEIGAAGREQTRKMHLVLQTLQSFWSLEGHGHGLNAAQVADVAIGVGQFDARDTLRRLHLNSTVVGTVLMLMFVMPDMPSVGCRLMLAIACSRCPGELERQQDKQQD